MNLFAQTLLIALTLNIALFLIAFTRKTDKLTDFAYGMSFIAIAVFCLWRADKQPLSSYLLLWLILLWGARLSIYLVYRIRTIKRDKRFDGMRESFRRFAQFWIAQAISAWVILIPAIYFFSHPTSSVKPLMLVGMAIWLVGFYFESVGDMQKFEFINNPKNKGKWIDQGLWKRSRHPNYFGEITMWFGIYVFCLPAMSTTAALVGAASPLWIFILLRFISGVPLLEKKANERWGKNPAYKKYRDSTPLLLPKLRS